MASSSRRLVGAFCACGLLLGAIAADAATVAYWRMEVDDDPSVTGLSVPNEVSGGSPLTSSEAALDGSNLPTTIVPLTSASNAYSVAASFQGAANGINASAAWYALLDVSSISIEFWARTQENTATPFSFTSGGLDGVTITDPNSLDVTWRVDVLGVPTAFALSNLGDMDTNWSHYAFVYEEITGLATFFEDGQLAGFFDGPDDSPLIVVPGTPVEIGVLMDYAEAGQGTIDEVRIDDGAIPPPLFLPEPRTGVLLGLGLSGLAMGRRRKSGPNR